MPFTSIARYTSDLRYFAEDVGILHEHLDGVTVEGFSPDGTAAYEGSLRTAFNFLRRQDDGRYSSRTKMRLLAAANIHEQARVTGANSADALPEVMLLSKPFSFDEETEVKAGGPIGVLVCWPGENGKMLLA